MFTLDINNVCQDDFVSFTNPVPNFTYSISNDYVPGVSVDSTVGPNIVQRYPLCPRTCSLSLVDSSSGSVVLSNPFSTDFVRGFLESTTQMSYGTNDKRLHNDQLTFLIRCTVTQGPTNQNTYIADNEFTVTLRDECFNTVFSGAPQRSDYTANVYFESIVSVQTISQSLNCNAIEYTLVPQGTTDVVTPASFVNNINDDGTIQTFPQSYNNTGLYDFKIRACISVQGNACAI